MNWFRSLAFRIIFCCAVLLALLGGITYGFFVHMLGDAQVFLESGEAMVEAFSVSIAQGAPDMESLRDRVESDGMRIHVWNLDGSEVFGGRGVQPGALSEPTLNAIPVDGRVVVEKTEEGVPALTLVRVVRDGETGKTYTVRIDRELSAQRQILGAFRNKFVLVLLALFVLTLAGLCYFTFETLKPLKALSERCQMIEEGNLRELEVKPNSREIIALENKFNEMIGSLREKEKMRDRLYHAEKLSALGNLAAGVAHDVRNPLNAIKLMVSHIRDLSHRDDHSKGGKVDVYSASIVEEINRLDTIVGDFLTLAREGEVRLIESCPDTLVESVVTMLEKEAHIRGMEITAELGLGTYSVSLDEEQFKRVLINLAINALDAMSAGGGLTFRTGIEGGEAFIEIIDTGRGISEEDISRVTEPYYTTKKAGTGLGLTISEQIIEQHGGRMEIDSRPGRGTSVKVILVDRMEGTPRNE
ncbi:ATP-binding protein [Candidatus Hydrogenedentota bacterium]